MAPRNRLFSFVVGASKSGKTVLVRMLTEAARQPRMVVDPAGTWGQQERVWAPDPWVPVARLLRRGYSGSLVFDDGDRYIPKNGHLGTWGSLWSQHRHFGCDVFIVARRVQELPDVAWSSADRLFVFRTLPGSNAERYLLNRGYVPKEAPIPREPLQYLEVDLFSGEWLQRSLTPEDCRRYGNPRGV